MFAENAQAASTSETLRTTLPALSGGVPGRSAEPPRSWVTVTRGDVLRRTHLQEALGLVSPRHLLSGTFRQSCQPARVSVSTSVKPDAALFPNGLVVLTVGRCCSPQGSLSRGCLGLPGAMEAARAGISTGFGHSSCWGARPSRSLAQVLRGLSALTAPPHPCPLGCSAMAPRCSWSPVSQVGSLCLLPTSPWSSSSSRWASTHPVQIPAPRAVLGSRLGPQHAVSSWSGCDPRRPWAQTLAPACTIPRPPPRRWQAESSAG